MMLFIVVVFLIAISSSSWCAAARPVPKCPEFDGEGPLTAYPSVYEKAKATMETWIARLPSGPSPKGPGH